MGGGKAETFFTLFIRMATSLGNDTGGQRHRKGFVRHTYRQLDSQKIVSREKGFRLITLVIEEFLMRYVRTH